MLCERRGGEGARWRCKAMHSLRTRRRLTQLLLIVLRRLEDGQPERKDEGSSRDSRLVSSAPTSLDFHSPSVQQSVQIASRSLLLRGSRGLRYTTTVQRARGSLRTSPRKSRQSETRSEGNIKPSVVQSSMLRHYWRQTLHPRRHSGGGQLES